jgi:hypothetical protein
MKKGTKVQWYKGTMVQWYKGTVAQWVKGFKASIAFTALKVSFL